MAVTRGVLNEDTGTVDASSPKEISLMGTFLKPRFYTFVTIS